MACDLGRGWERASDRVACQASRRAEPACVCLPRERVPCGVHACRARRWCAAAPATTDRNARAGPCRMLGPGAQRRPPVIVYTCFEKSSRSPYCTREPRRRAHCVILIYNRIPIITRPLSDPSCDVGPVSPPARAPAAHCAHNKRLYGFIIYRSPRTPQARPLHLFGLLSRAGCTKTYPRVFTPASRTIRTDRTLSRMSTGEHARRPSAPHPRAPHMPDDTEPLA